MSRFDPSSIRTSESRASASIGRRNGSTRSRSATRIDDERPAASIEAGMGHMGSEGNMRRTRGKLAVAALARRPARRRADSDVGSERQRGPDRRDPLGPGQMGRDPAGDRQGAQGLAALEGRAAAAHLDSRSPRSRDLRDRTRQVDEGIAETSDERRQLIDRNDDLKRASTTLETEIVTLESKTRQLIDRVPTLIKDRIKILSPSGSRTTRRRPR